MEDRVTETETVKQGDEAASQEQDCVVEDTELEAQVLVLECDPLKDGDAFPTTDDDDEDEGDAFSRWMRLNFPSQEALEALEALRLQEHQRIAVETSCRWCDECNKRVAVLACADCGLSLCFTCTDAIHIIDAFAAHTIAPTTHEDPPPPQNDQEPPIDPPPPQHDALPEPPSMDLASCPAFHPTTRIEHRLHLPVGTKLFFRADDCGRWARELLHGSIVGRDHGVRSDADAAAFYYRVVWLRGVEALANGFFRANLVLPRPFWPLEIGLFPSQLSAFRAVLTAERLARAMLRRERSSGRWHDDRDVVSQRRFPTVDILNEILDETDAILGHEFRTRLTHQDDAALFEAVSTGTWDYSDWMKHIGREHELPEEAAAIHEADDALKSTTDQSLVAETLLLWSPRSRLRFFLLEQRDLLLPATVQKAHVASIVHQMLFVFMGFAWQRWRAFTTRHRRHERHARRHAAATRLEQWWRRHVAQQRQQNLLKTSPLDALALYRARQVQAAKLYDFMMKQYTEKQRRALRRWADATIDTIPSRERREAQTAAMAAAARGAWHPSHDIPSLPRLPRMYAHRKPDGSVAIDDLALYKQFRANHAGPTESSYWVVRHRVLMGVYPAGAAFRDARRMVSRADYTTSVLLEHVGTFVCLLEPAELEAHEPTVDASCLVQLQQQRERASRLKKEISKSPRPQTPWLFERIVRAKHELLRVELESAVKVNERLADLAQRELDDVLLAPPSAIGVVVETETLETKRALAEQNLRHARDALARLPSLDFVLFPIVRDGVPADPNALDAFLVDLEDRLRRHERLFVFSREGHGRTGVIAALLLGRLYGLTPTDALERAQRHHDCQYALHGARASPVVSSPHAACQITLVTQLLTQTNDAIYARVVRSNTAAQYTQWRAQQRGLPLDATRDGFLISDRVDDALQQLQEREVETLARVAKRESMATRLQLARRREQKEREMMEWEDEIYQI